MDAKHQDISLCKRGMLSTSTPLIPRGSRILNIEFERDIIVIKYMKPNLELRRKVVSYHELYKTALIID